MSTFQSSRSCEDNFNQPDLVLIQTPGWGIATPPLALATLASYMRQQGFKVLPLDLNAEHYTVRKPPYHNVWDIDISGVFWNNYGMVDKYISDCKELIESHVAAIVATKPKLIVFSVYNSCIQLSFSYARLIRELDPNIKIIFGGPHASRNMAGDWAANQPFTDACVQGEGETMLLEVLQRVLNGQSLLDCKGLLLRHEGRVVDTGDSTLIQDLNALPYADFTDYDFRLYADWETLPIMSSRGCPNRCIYCSERAYWRTYRGFNAARIVDEIEAQMKLYPFIKRIEFQDSLVNGNIKRLEQFAELVVERNLKFRWAGQAVIRKEMTLPLFKKLKASGCECLAYGLETSSRELMLNIGKLLAKETDIDRLVIEAHEAGISCAYNFMFGMPGETVEDAKASLEFLHKHKDRIGTVNPSAAFCGFTRGTPGFDTPEKFGIEPSKEEGQFWESDGGKNNILVRLERFEAFCELTMDLKVRTTYPHRRLLDRNRIIGSYYFSKKQYGRAADHLQPWLDDHLSDSEIARKLAHCREELNAHPKTSDF